MCNDFQVFMEEGMRDIFKLPLNLPIDFNNVTLGFIEIDFKKNIKKVKNTKQQLYFNKAFLELIQSAFYIRQQIESSLKMFPEKIGSRAISFYLELYVGSKKE